MFLPLLASLPLALAQENSSPSRVCVSSPDWGSICADVNQFEDRASLRNFTATDFRPSDFITVSKNDDTKDSIPLVRVEKIQSDGGDQKVLGLICTSFFGSKSKVTGFSDLTWRKVVAPEISWRVKASSLPIRSLDCDNAKIYGGKTPAPGFKAEISKPMNVSVRPKVLPPYYIASRTDFDQTKSLTTLTLSDSVETMNPGKSSPIYVLWNAMPSAPILIKSENPKNPYSVDILTKAVPLSPTVKLSCYTFLDASFSSCSFLFKGSKAAFTLSKNSNNTGVVQRLSQLKLDGYDERRGLDSTFNAKLNPNDGNVTFTYALSSTYLNCGPYTIYKSESAVFSLWDEKIAATENSEGLEFAIHSSKSSSDLLTDLTKYYRENGDPGVHAGISSGFYTAVGSLRLDVAKSNDEDIDLPSNILKTMARKEFTNLPLISIEASNMWNSPNMQFTYQGFKLTLNCERPHSIWLK